MAVKQDTTLAPLRQLYSEDQRLSVRRRPIRQVKTDPDAEYEVDLIVNEGIRESGVTLYRVKWSGYSDEYNTWEPARNLERCRDVLRRWQDLKNRLQLHGNASLIDSHVCRGDTIFDKVPRQDQVRPESRRRKREREARGGRRR